MQVMSDVVQRESRISRQEDLQPDRLTSTATESASSKLEAHLGHLHCHSPHVIGVQRCPMIKVRALAYSQSDARGPHHLRASQRLEKARPLNLQG